MMAKITYLGDLRTEAEHLRSGNKIITDAPVDNRGRGEAFSPTDLTAASLASCILTIMGIAAMDKGLDMQGAEASVTKIMTNSPRCIESIEIEIKMPDKGYTDKEKKLLEKAAHHCPVSLSLSKDTRELIKIIW